MAFTFGWDTNELGNGAPIGGVYMRSGWFKSAGGSVGGDVITGFKQCYIFIPIMHAAAVGNAIAVNEAVADVSVAGFTGDVSIVSDADEVGKWLAFGV